MTLLSILIPVYNQAVYLQECLDSVLKQQFKDFEVIAINDGSTDDSLSILKRNASTNPQIKILSQSNGGYGRAMNAGLRAARGTYIGIVESDDTIDQHMYSKLMNAAKQTGADIVKCSFRRVFSAALYLEERGWREAAGGVFTLKERPEICRLHPAIWSAIYKRSLLEENRIVFCETPGASYQDVPFFAETFSSAQSIYVIPEALYHYRIESANAFSSSNAIDERVFYRMKNHQLAKTAYENKGVWPLVQDAEIQREFITLNNFALRIRPSLRKRLYQEMRLYFQDVLPEDAARFLPRQFRRSFRLIRQGHYIKWFLTYALAYILILRISKPLGLTNRIRQYYYQLAKKEH